MRPLFDGFDELTDTDRASEQGAWMVVKDPFGSGRNLMVGGRQVRLKLYGPDSQVAYQSSTATTMRFDKARGMSEDGTVTREIAVRILAETTAPLVMEWENVLDNGKPVPCTRENVERLFRARPRVRAQADEFAGRIANFSPPSAESSSPPSAEGSDER